MVVLVRGTKTLTDWLAGEGAAAAAAAAAAMPCQATW
jgi:hypothetical protein